MDTALMSVHLSEHEFFQIRDLLHQICGIHMPPGKDGLVKARLIKRLKFLNLGSFADYISYVQNDSSGQELAIMVDALTTNKTNFFREQAHFDFLESHVLPSLQKKQKMRFWSAACSTGEEPYSLAIQLFDSVSGLEQMDVRILATDISPTVLDKARLGLYENERMEGISEAQKRKYFTAVKQDQAMACGVTDRVKKVITFARLNLMNTWPMQGLFDVVFCRNVMIYFDKDTREKLVNRFYDILQPGGYLFVGHSESLSSLKHPFDYVQPATYVK